MKEKKVKEKVEQAVGVGGGGGWGSAVVSFFHGRHIEGSNTSVAALLEQQPLCLGPEDFLGKLRGGAGGHSGFPLQHWGLVQR